MKQVVKKATSEKSGSNPLTMDWTLGLQLLDTTWRVAIPIVVFTFGGVWLDKHYSTKPLLTLVGLFLSLLVSTLLVYRQIKEAYPEFFRGAKK